MLKSITFSEKQKTFISYVSETKFKSNIIVPSFKSHIPLDRKFKIENLFEFKRKDGDLFLSFICLLFAGFIIFNFSSETGWEDRVLDHKRFGKILKQPWVGPLACVAILLPASLLKSERHCSPAVVLLGQDYLPGRRIETFWLFHL